MKSKVAMFIAIKIIAITTLIKGLNQASHLVISLSQPGMPKIFILPTVLLLFISVILWFGAAAISNTISSENNEEIEIHGITIYDLYKIALTTIGIFIIVSVLPEIIRNIIMLEAMKNQMQTSMIYSEKISIYILFLELILGLILAFKSNNLAKIINSNHRVD
jgi:hypothetical protein